MNKLQERIKELEEEISIFPDADARVNPNMIELKGIKFAQEEILKMIDNGLIGILNDYEQETGKGIWNAISELREEFKKQIKGDNDEDKSS